MYTWQLLCILLSYDQCDWYNQCNNWSYDDVIGTINAIIDHMIDMNDVDNNMINSTTNITVNLNCIATVDTSAIAFLVFAI